MAGMSYPRFYICVPVILLACLTILPQYLSSQNLFPNPGFEQYTVCATATAEIFKCTSWNEYKLDGSSTTDYYNCTYYGPIQYQGTPSSGNGVVGMWGVPKLVFCSSSAYVESMTAELLCSIDSGRQYVVSADLMIDNKGNLTAPPSNCLDFGIYFFNTGTQPPTSGSCCPGFSPHVRIKGEDLLQGTYKTFTYTITPLANYDKVYIGPFCNSNTAACNKPDNMYFNLDNLFLIDISPPTNEISLGNDTSICKGDTIVLTPNKQGNSYLWDNGTTDSSLSVFSPGSYSVKVSNSCGADADTININYKDCSETVQLSFPNIITPNNDGINDAFVVRGLTFSDWELFVYNRWGSEVYNTTLYKNDWAPYDLPEGTYYYYMQSEKNNQKHTGYFMLMR